MRGDCSKLSGREDKEDNERKDEANKHTHNTYIEVRYTLNKKNKEGIEGGREGPKLIKRKEREKK